MFKIALAALFAFATAQNFPEFPGPCRTVDDFGGAHTGANGFNVAAFLGTWYEIEK
jgi:hypothetical protein